MVAGFAVAAGLVDLASFAATAFAGCALLADPLLADPLLTVLVLTACLPVTLPVLAALAAVLAVGADFAAVADLEAFVFEAASCFFVVFAAVLEPALFPAVLEPALFPALACDFPAVGAFTRVVMTTVDFAVAAFATVDLPPDGAVLPVDLVAVPFAAFVPEDFFAFEAVAAERTAALVFADFATTLPADFVSFPAAEPLVAGFAADFLFEFAFGDAFELGMLTLS